MREPKDSASDEDFELLDANFFSLGCSPPRFSSVLYFVKILALETISLILTMHGRRQHALGRALEKTTNDVGKHMMENKKACQATVAASTAGFVDHPFSHCTANKLYVMQRECMNEQNVEVDGCDNLGHGRYQLVQLYVPFHSLKQGGESSVALKRKEPFVQDRDLFCTTWGFLFCV